MPAILERLQRIGTLIDADVEPATTLLLLEAQARGMPWRSLGKYHRHLDQLTDAVRTYVGDVDLADSDLACEALAQVLSRRFGYGGTWDLDAGEEGGLMQAIDARRSAAFELALLYIYTARAQGWSAEGIDFPARFLVRLNFAERRVLIDPFDGGRIVEAPDLRELAKASDGNQAEITPDFFHSLSNRDMIVRLQMETIGGHLRAGRIETTIAMIGHTLLTAPDDAELWRTKGVLHARLEHIAPAIDAIEKFLEMSQDNQDGSVRYRMSVLLQQLRNQA